jgi:DUF1365 family protein
MKQLFRANIYHKRFLPKVNEFTYTGFYIKFSLEEMQSLKSVFFRVNKFNIFSFYEKDHGYRDGSSLTKWARDILEKSGFNNFNGTITLQTFPRVLGYVFNPISFYYCYEQDKLLAVICEVNNTFGESHNYVLNQDPNSQCNFLKKHFHVSPFYDIKGGYQFDFRNPTIVNINYHFDEQLQLTTRVSGLEIPFSDKNLIKLFFRYPCYTVFVVLLIHVQALKLFMKKIKFYTKPQKEKNEVTYE